MATRLLVCDDTPEIRFLLRTVFRRYDDVEVVGEATNGLEAVTLAGELEPDVVLLDLAMPVMDGLEALPLLKEAVPDCRIIVLSGFDRHSMAERALALGAETYLEKGCSPGTIAAAVRDPGASLDRAVKKDSGPVYSARKTTE